MLFFSCWCCYSSSVIGVVFSHWCYCSCRVSVLFLALVLLLKYLVAFVKDKGPFNLNTMTIALKLVVSYDVLGLKESFRELVLVMHFLKHDNMQQHMKFFAKD